MGLSSNYLRLSSLDHYIKRPFTMPCRRYGRRPIQFLTRAWTEALPAAPDLDTRAGRRDRTLLLAAV